MHTKSEQRLPVLIILSISLLSGCDEESAQIAREAANRQAQQNTVMADLNKEVAGGTRRLVESDAHARQEIIGVHRDLQDERRRLDINWNSLEQERQLMAGQRRTESLLVPIAQSAGLVSVVFVLLGFCWHAVAAARRNEASDSQLNELLIGEMLHDQPLLLADTKNFQSFPTYCPGSLPPAE
jgi:hypothetical protein